MRKKMILGFFIIFLGTLIISCGKNNDDKRQEDHPFDRIEDPEDRYRDGYTVIVAKPDGSLQCYPNSGLTLYEMAREQLPGVPIISASKQRSG